MPILMNQTTVVPMHPTKHKQHNNQQPNKHYTDLWWNTPWRPTCTRSLLRGLLAWTSRARRLGAEAEAEVRTMAATQEGYTGAAGSEESSRG